MGFFKKLVKGIGKVAGKVGKGVLKIGGAVLSSGLIPVPGSALVGKMVSNSKFLNSKTAQSLGSVAGSLVKSNTVAGALIGYSGKTPVYRQPALPAISQNLTTGQAKVFGQKSFFSGVGAPGAYATKPISKPAIFTTKRPDLPSILPAPPTTSFLGIGDKKKDQEAKAEKQKKILTAVGIGVPVLGLLIALFKK